MRRTTRTRSRQLDRDIAAALSRRGTRSKRHHATVQECPSWEPESPIDQLTEAKRRAAAEFERCYLVNLMKRAGSVSEAARMARLDRTNFRRLLTRHGLRAREP